MKKETSLRKVIETLSAYDVQAEDARLVSIHGVDLEDDMNYVFRIRHADGFIRAVKIPLYEEIEEPVLTKEKAIKRHRMMWNWIGDETLKRERFVTKQEAIEHFGWDDSKMYNGCWCCTYVCRICKDRTCKDNCPIRWPGDTCCDDFSRGNKGLYDKWRAMRGFSNYKEAADLAYQIANLPEREDGNEQ